MNNKERIIKMIKLTLKDGSVREIEKAMPVKQKRRHIFNVLPSRGLCPTDSR